MTHAIYRVTEALELAGSRRQGQNYQCPAHEDNNASLHLHADNRGVGLKCHAGCDWRDVMNALGLAPDDLFNERREVARYNYLNRDGEVLFAKIRYEPKGFAIQHPTADGWENGLNGAERPLYRLPEILAAAHQVIYLVEGEKDADRLWEMGVPATTNFDGAGKKWRAEYSQWLAGMDVVVVADRDEPGEEHARTIAASLKNVARSVRIVQSKVAGKGADISDHLDAGYCLDELVPVTAVQNEVSRKYARVNWREAFTMDTSEPEWLLEPFMETATINALFGKPGVGKSLITLEWALQLAREGRSVLYIDQENSVRDTVTRLRAFRCTPGELDGLALYSFANLPPLDTDEGGAHLVSLAEANEADLIILDTISRMVEGSENDASTYSQLYRFSMAPLKQHGRSVLRLDHSGKDEGRGQRGSSAKASDLDCLFRISLETAGNLVVVREKSRSGNAEACITYSRQRDPLRHEIVAIGDMPVLPQIKAIASWFDRHDVPRMTGRPALRDFLKDTQGAPEVSTTMLALVAKFRKGQHESAGQSA